MAYRTAPRIARTVVLALALTGVVMAPSQAKPGTADRPDAGALTGAPLALTSRVDAAKAPSSRLAQTDPELLRRNDSEPVQVVLKLDYDAVASYSGGVGGLAATSPRVTGKALSGGSPAEKAYARYLQDREEGVVRALRAAVPSADVGGRFRTVYGGLAATIPASAVETVLKIDGVTAVQQNSLRQPLTDASPEFLDAPPVYSDLGGVATAGAGVIYGNLDSGVWPEHPSFADLGLLEPPPGPARECDFGDNPLTPAVDPFTCQNKLIGGAAFLDAYLEDPEDAAAEPFHSARDSNGHGTHTASTSAGNIVEDVSVLGSPLPPIHGLAPGAWVMEYKVCGILGCVSSDSMAAVEQAIKDGVDVINFSISGGTSPFTDPVELAFLDAYAAGVLVSASAGNEGPGASTANHLGAWTTTVGASTHDREFATTLTLSAADGSTATFEGASITGGTGPYPVVLSSAAPYSDDLCGAPAPAGSLEGLIVACKRGVNARVDKGYNVLQGGAEGMILYNPTLADVETDTHWLPTVHLADGTDFVAFMQAHPDTVGSFPAASAQEGRGDVMAAFSSRGPAGLFIKPDLTAPGVQILAGDTPIMESPTEGPPGELFQAIAGTSMSSPHVAGAAILLRARHPDWTPGQIRSALMTTAVTDVVKEDLQTPADPFDMGAGRIDIDGAAAVPLTIDETAERFAAMADDPANAVHLNLPSVNAPIMPGMLRTQRVLTNTGTRPLTVKATGHAPKGSSIKVNERPLTIRPGGSATLHIELRSWSAPGEQKFGSVKLTTRGSVMHLPVAFIHTQGSVSLSQTCTPDDIRVGNRATCTVEAVNTSLEERNVDLQSVVNRQLRVTGAEGATVVGPQTVRLDDVVLAGGVPAVPSVDPVEPPGYLPLDLFGIDPVPIGDEEILNFTGAPAFQYNGATFTSFGVDSNGYVVAGGATVEDNNCCDLPDGPDPVRPNNMLAPFWTDLDGTDAPGILVGVLSDSVTGDEWVVVEYRVNVFGTDDLRVFQVWIGAAGNTAGGQDITYSYDPANPAADPDGQDFLVGAENGLGQGDMEAVLPTGDLRVTSSDATPGDTLRYRYTVRGVKTGTGVATTKMVSDDIPGVTIVRSEIRVKR